MSAGPPIVDDGSNEDPSSGYYDVESKFGRWRKSADAHWSQWRQSAREEFDFVAGVQWDADDIRALEDNNRLPVVFNLTNPTINAVSGAEIQNRQQVTYFPREVGDTGVSDALTQASEYLSDECNGDQEDSEAFRDALICGVGWTLTKPEVDGDRATIIRERIDPLQMVVDPSSRKACFEDARYLRRDLPMSREEFEEFAEEIGASDVEPANDPGDVKRPTIVDPRIRYTNGMFADQDADEVVVSEWQWWEKRPVYVVAMPHPEQPGTMIPMKLNEEQFGEVQEIAPDVQHTKSMQKVYFRAYECGGVVMAEPEELECGCFTYKAITGMRDRNRNVWFGLVRAMMDPQRFTNKLYSEVIHIIRTNAKGGMVVEEGAVEDIRQFEESWAQADAITWAKDGAVAQNRITPKVAPPVPPQIFQMMEWAREMVRACTGVNEEILGLAGREQPGVLEAQRKQAAYGLLSPFFDAQRRYLRNQGKLQLAMIRLYLPEDTLVRIVDEGTKKYVPVAYTMDAAEYDVRVDESPAGPNQKAMTFQTMLQLMPFLQEAGLPPSFWSKIALYSPLPASVAEELSAAFGEIQKQSEQGPPPEQQQMAQAEIENKQADTMKKVSGAQLDQAKADREAVNVMQPEPIL